MNLTCYIQRPDLARDPARLFGARVKAQRVGHPDAAAHAIGLVQGFINGGIDHFDQVACCVVFEGGGAVAGDGDYRVTANSVFGVTMALLKETCHDHT